MDNLTRGMVVRGALQALLDQGVRGVTSNPTIFAKAMGAGSDYDEQFHGLITVHPVEDAYWELVLRDITDAADVLRPLHEESGGGDGFVSIEVAPAIAADTEATVRAARWLNQRVGRPNLLVKIPATVAGVAAVERCAAAGVSVNVTLIFGLARYEEVIEAWLTGLERRDGDVSGVHGVASFFVSRVDAMVDQRLEAVGTPEALARRGTVAVAQAKLAYQLFRQRFAGPRWEQLRARGATLQRPLWASTSTKNPAYPDLLYVDSLIGPDTVNTMPDATLAAFADHGRLARTVDAEVDEAQATLDRVAEVGVDMDDVARVLEEQGVAAFADSYDSALAALAEKAPPGASRGRPTA
ncbi:MAG: transaldolase, partial [Actinomycetota bacterium]|nr:transaldolase [Actinomycetota bacterium]